MGLITIVIIIITAFKFTVIIIISTFKFRLRKSTFILKYKRINSERFHSVAVSYEYGQNEMTCSR